VNKSIESAIDRVNQRREEQAVYTAERLIELIAAEQAKIRSANEAIVRLRKSLSEVQIDTVNAADILGA
jgi:hypothetical protein